MKKNLGPAAKPAAPLLRMVLTGVAAYFIVVALLLLGMTPEQYDIKVGFPASIDILATKDITDAVTTEANRKRAADQVEESYKSVDNSVLGAVTSALNEGFTRLRNLRDGADASISDDALARLNAALPAPVSREQYTALLEADPGMLEELFSAATESARDALISTLPQGQEDAAVARISRVLTSSGYPSELVSLAADVLRSCIRPNMLIDVEITEANRQKAMEAVEPTTFLRGEAIVRRGERVTEAQYQMLATLGLLKEETLDVQMMGGIALLVLLVMCALALYLYIFERGRLNPKTVMLIALIFVLVLALSLALGYWNAYLVPVSLGMMLLSLLVGRRLALFTNLALGVILSLLNTVSAGRFTMSMLSFIMMAVVSGPIILCVYTRRTQRTTTLLAGVLVGLSNFFVTLAIGLINSSELHAVLTNAVWSVGSGLLSAVLCIGIQPLLELIFNLATNSKLIELSNPNQPLLRRLLLEAPGTYHHSIIVANLAEAGADAIGANGLLARVGAYYHDVGKLKRPGYFTENQVGDNPHDRTDPRVSAAILTAHPRDGYQLAQKARMPQSVLEIIRQHHGDGVTLYFYDKAVKQYGADQVDINAFRYEGPRPRSKEAATVMLADTIEAATRSIPNPTPEKVEAMIRKLVRGKLDDGQLDESALTFKDLDLICGAFSTVLTGVFHERIEYPDIAVPPRAETAAEPKPAPESPRQAQNAPEAPKAPAPHAPSDPAAEPPKPAAPQASADRPQPLADKPQSQTRAAAGNPSAQKTVPGEAAGKVISSEPSPVTPVPATAKPIPEVKLAQPAATEPRPAQQPVAEAKASQIQMSDPKPAQQMTPEPKPAQPSASTAKPATAEASGEAEPHGH